VLTERGCIGTSSSEALWPEVDAAWLCVAALHQHVYRDVPGWRTIQAGF
jgi:hypothetical protein